MTMRPLTICRHGSGTWLWFCEKLHSGRHATWAEALTEALAHCPPRRKRDRLIRLGGR